MSEIVKQMYPTLPEEDRAIAMKEAADEVLSGKYIRPLNLNEVLVKKDELAKAIVKMNSILREYETVKSKYKLMIKPEQEKIDYVSEVLRTESEEVDGNLYGFIDEDLRLMVSYDDRGNFVSTRQLRSDEMSTIFTTMRNPNSIALNSGDYEIKAASGQ